MDEKELLKALLEIRMIANEMIPSLVSESANSDKAIQNLKKIIKLTDAAAESHKKGLAKVVE